MNSIEKRLPSKVLEFIGENHISDGSVLIVGFSGGPDSTALLLSLYQIKKQINFSLKAAYVNHGIRDASQLKKDDSFVSELCLKLGIELFIETVAPGVIGEISRSEGRSSEEVARDYRYTFFNRILDSFPDSLLMLGHTMDDQMETLITRFFQGAGFGGLKGIPGRNGRILRPLIQCRKSEILKYLKEEKQSFCTDPTNLENDYLRNSVRNTLIPVVESIFPGYVKSLKVQQKRFLEIDELIAKQSDELGCIHSGSSSRVPLILFNKAHSSIRLNLLYSMFDNCYRGGVKGFRVPERFFKPLLSGLIIVDKQYAAAYGIRIYTDTEHLIFSAAGYLNTGFFALLQSKKTIVPGRYIVEQGDVTGFPIEKAETSALVFRSIQDRDFILLNNRKKMVKSIIRDWKIEDEIINLIPVLEDSYGISAILGEFAGKENIYRNKKINSSGKFNILYLGVRRILNE